MMDNRQCWVIRKEDSFEDSLLTIYLSSVGKYAVVDGKMYMQ